MKKVWKLIMLLVITIVCLTLVACKNNEPANPTDITITQNDVGFVFAKDVLPDGATIDVEPIASNGERAAEINNLLAGKPYEKDKAVMFEINAKSNGIVVQPNGQITVTLNKPFEDVTDYVVYHIKGDNAVEELNPTVNGAKISFITNSFSPFIIAKKHTHGEEYNYVNLGESGHQKEYACCGAKIGEVESHSITKGVCSLCDYQIITVVGNGSERHVLFGSYPQTLVTDETVIASLGEFDETTWTSFGFYISSKVEDYTFYIDKEYNGEKYRGVYFTKYRPSVTSEANVEENTNQQVNGYVKDTVYWFKYEPIKWRIITSDYEESGKSLLFCDIAIDCQHWDGKGGAYSNKYTLSTIRTWLNGVFYDTAFDDLQKELVETFTIDNSVESAMTNKYGGNPYVVGDTDEKVFLLSFKEIIGTYETLNERTELERMATDYAKALGCRVCQKTTEFMSQGAISWFLRSPNPDSPDHITAIEYSGSVEPYGYRYVLETRFGVVPAIVVDLR